MRGINQQQFAEEIGISTPSLRKMLKGRWKYVHRSHIERVMDYLGLKANDVFESIPATFWDPIKESGSCVFICGTTRNEAGIAMPKASVRRAADVIERFFEKSVAMGKIQCRYENELSQEELLHLVQTENCIVLGSPKTNPATEFLLSRICDAEKIRFGFSWGVETAQTKESSLACSSTERTRLQGKPGIAWHHGEIKVEFQEQQAYEDWETKDAKDAALVLIVNSPFGAEKAVKLVILAGVGGMGTLAAAHALIQDFRELQPISTSTPFVYGILEAHYSKQRGGSDARIYKNFNWLYRKGSRMPIDKKTDKKTNSKSKAVASD
jgi:hypothetical protein